MQVKVKSSDGRESAYSCDGYDKWEEEGDIVVRVLPLGKVLKIPRDGDVIYVESGEGKTVNTFTKKDNGTVSVRQPSFRALDLDR